MGVSIAEFLISIGFQVSTGQLNKFKNAQQGAAAGFSKLTGAAELAAAAVFAAVARMSDDLDKLYFVSQRTKASADNLAAFAYGAGQVGVKADAAAGSIEALASNLRRMPGLRGLLQNMGINPAGDATKIAEQLHAALEKRFPNRQDVQLRYADMFGIDERLYLQLGQMAAFEKERNADAASMGVNLQVATKAANGLWTELRRIWMLLGLMAQKAVQQGAPAIQATLERLQKFLVDHAQQIATAIVVIVNAVTTFFDIVTRVTLSIAAFIGAMMNWYNSLDSAAQGIVKVFGALLIAWRALSIGLLTTPLGIIIASLTTLFLLLDDWMTFEQHGRGHSLFDWSAMDKAVKAFSQQLHDAGVYAQQGWQWLIDLVKIMSDVGLLPRVAEQAKRTAGQSGRADMPGTAPGTTNAAQEENGRQIAASLKDSGVGIDDINAILGNLDPESSLNPKAGEGTAHVGLAQWSETRQRQFQEHMGKSVLDASPAEQAAYIAWDLSPAGHYAAVGEAMRNATSLEDKTRIFAEGYETPALPGSAAMNAEDDKRIARAQYYRGRALSLRPAPSMPGGYLPWSLPGLLHRFGFGGGEHPTAEHLPVEHHDPDRVVGGTSPFLPPVLNGVGHLDGAHLLPNSHLFRPGYNDRPSDPHLVQHTNIHVHGATDAHDAARRVADAQHDVNGRLLRNTRGVLS